jgi:hypothetical protein
MSRGLIALNAAFALIALAAIGYVVHELRVPAPGPDVARRPIPEAAPAVPAAPAAAETPPGTYGVVAGRNLFSPTRTEAPPSPVAAGQTTAKPSLYGILVTDTFHVAYLEDPITKRVAGYRIGDSVAGGKLTQIAADFVVLNRPDGDVNVRLRDPFKPRSAPAAVPGQGGSPVPAAPGAPPRAVVPSTPGAQGIPAGPGVSPTQPTQPIQPIPQPPTPGLGPPTAGPPILPRRPLPPNLSRRLPPAGTNAPAQD